jgi:hypothetical protein
MLADLLGTDALSLVSNHMSLYAPDPQISINCDNSIHVGR